MFVDQTRKTNQDTNVCKKALGKIYGHEEMHAISVSCNAAMNLE